MMASPPRIECTATRLSHRHKPFGEQTDAAATPHLDDGDIERAAFRGVRDDLRYGLLERRIKGARQRGDLRTASHLLGVLQTQLEAEARRGETVHAV